MWRSLVSRLVRVQEASGSNPDTPTKIPESANVDSGIFFMSGFEKSNATRMSVAADGLTEANLYFCLLTGKNANESRHSDLSICNPIIHDNYR